MSGRTLPVLFCLAMFGAVALCVDEDKWRSDPKQSEVDRRILKQGEVSEIGYLLGGFVGTFPGFGLGHTVQGRWGSKGWWFTLGELVSVFGGMGAAALSCYKVESSDTSKATCGFIGVPMVVIGAIAFIIFRVWEIFDVWVEPGKENARLKELEDRYGENRLERARGGVNVAYFSFDLPF